MRSRRSIGLRHTGHWSQRSRQRTHATVCPHGMMAALDSAPMQMLHSSASAIAPGSRPVACCATAKGCCGRLLAGLLLEERGEEEGEEGAMVAGVGAPAGVHGTNEAAAEPAAEGEPMAAVTGREARGGDEAEAGEASVNEAAPTAASAVAEEEGEEEDVPVSALDNSAASDGAPPSVVAAPAEAAAVVEAAAAAEEEPAGAKDA